MHVVVWFGRFALVSEAITRRRGASSTLTQPDLRRKTGDRRIAPGGARWSAGSLRRSSRSLCPFQRW